MRRSEFIYRKANEIAKQAGTRNPMNVASDIGIEIYWKNNMSRLLAFYTVINKRRSIVVNDRLEEYMLRMVVAHEIGHDILHRAEAKKGAMQEFEIFDMKNTLEYEANVFAAHLLLDTKEIMEMAHDGVDVASIACRMCVNINLVLIKISELITLGYDLRMPMDTKRDFLRDIIV